MRTSEQFWNAVDRSAGPTGCWLWQKSIGTHGYGWVNWGGTITTSNRVAFFIHNGFWPVYACHRCDVRACCNPEHIFNGTHQDNMADMNRKGRHFKPVGHQPQLRAANEARRKPLKPCGCGCGTMVKRTYARGHTPRVVFTLEVRAKISAAKRKA